MSELRYVDVRIAVAVADTGAWRAEGACPADGDMEDWAAEAATQAREGMAEFEPGARNTVVHFVTARVPMPISATVQGWVPYPIDALSVSRGKE